MEYELDYKVAEGDAPVELHRNRFLRVMFDGRHHYVEYNRYRSGVIIIPRWPDGDYEMVKIQRVPSMGISIEFPRGGVEPGETPQVAALRELVEETGLRADLRTLHHVGQVFGDTATIDSWCDVFVAQIDPDAPVQRVAAHEPTEPVRVTTAFVAHAIKTNLIRDGLTLSAVMLAHASECAGSPPHEKGGARASDVLRGKY